MPRQSKNTSKIRANRHQRAKGTFALSRVLDIVQKENRQLAQKDEQSRKRVQELEEQLEERQEQIVEIIQRNWMREEKYSRLVVERNRLRARMENLEKKVEEIRSNNINRWD
ncbi:13046_t:CDS:2 [Cetraspora pellucida]|uniref:13046_t:CDS:1 n=1 Tax=Cetraspora pellucida TaxID=1433469 RepID=A0ACA9KJH9_9GLOM|nr:13046_t:CDS:2 [Cetraspora pellucida]